jgi:hypothetical protein
MKNSLEDLHNHLFAQLERLREHNRGHLSGRAGETADSGGQT